MGKVFDVEKSKVKYLWCSSKEIVAKRRAGRIEVDLINYKTDSSKKISCFKLVVHSFHSS